MSCDAKFVSLKIEQVNGKNYLGAAAANGAPWAYVRLGLPTGCSCPG